MSRRTRQGHRSHRWTWPDRVVMLCCAALLVGFVMPPDEPGGPLPELAPLEPQERKAEFFGYLRPIVARVNDEVRRQRERLASIRRRDAREERLSWRDRRFLRRIAKRFEVALDDDRAQVLTELWHRVDVVPRSLVLVQAAKESAWGTSRFAIEGNNLFGQRCYRPGCGLTPKRAEQPRFRVAAYDSTYQSVREYMRNLNTHDRYGEFRRLRRTAREREEALSGLRLANGLVDYSERGEAYVAEIKALIRQNDLEGEST